MHLFFKKNYHYCPRCRTKLAEKNEALRCGKCHFSVYDNPAPCVTVLVVKDKQVLLAKRAIEPKKGYWDLPGGFLNSGESIEEAVIRELKEETNLDVKITDYLGSIADTYEDVPIVPVIIEVAVTGGQMKALDDVAKLKWFNINDLPKTKLAFKNTKIAFALIKEKYAQ